ncbi:hypothetical protein AOLI_G00195590 [Acnodon oligacanthus]
MSKTFAQRLKIVNRCPSVQGFKDRWPALFDPSQTERIGLQDGIVSRHRSGEGFKNISAALKSAQEQRRLHHSQAIHPQDNQGPRALVRQVTKNPMFTMQHSTDQARWAPERLNED